MDRVVTKMPDELERRIYEMILSFPGRIDEMETRSEDNCRLLARRIADLVRQQGGPGSAETA
jgi:hypothetical protein